MTHKSRTITLSNRPPVRIIDADWPEIAKAEVRSDMVNRSLRVRRHADGRTLVYGVNSRAGYKDDRAGVLLDADRTIARWLQIVAEKCGCVDLVADCIASLPAEELR
jgi:hypothetical protein